MAGKWFISMTATHRTDHAFLISVLVGESKSVDNEGVSHGGIGTARTTEKVDALRKWLKHVCADTQRRREQRMHTYEVQSVACFKLNCKD